MNENELDEINRYNEMIDAELRSWEPDYLVFRYLSAKFGRNVENTLLPFGGTLDISNKIEELLDKIATKNN